MQTRNPILDDLARAAAGALGVAAGMGKEAEEIFKQRFAAVISSEGFVTREEFEAVKAMAAMARAENDALETRIAELEAAKLPTSPAKYHGSGIRKKAPSAESKSRKS